MSTPDGAAAPAAAVAMTAGENAAGEVVASVEETNRVRALLGLKPLDMGGARGAAGGGADRGLKEGEVAVDWEARRAEQSAEELRARVAKARQRREVDAKFAGVKGLGEASDDEDGGSGGGDSAAAWVAKSRAEGAKKEQERQRKEREQAERMAAMLAEQDEGSDSDADDVGAGVSAPPVAAGATYTSRDLAGLKVTHGGDAMKEGQTIVLTLKDTGVLDTGDDGELAVNDEEDELENVRMAELDKQAKAKREAKPLPKSVYVDKFAEEDAAGGGGGGVLAKYDTVIEGGEEADGGMQLGADGGVAAEEAARRAEVKRKLAGGLPQPGSAAETLDTEMKQASEFYTEKEMASFRKPKKEKKKKKKIRSRRLAADDLEAIVAEEGGLPSAGTGLGSRKDSAARRKEQAQASKRGVAAQNYAQARAKAEDRAKVLREEGRVAAARMAPEASVPPPADIDEEEADEDELAASIERARLAKIKASGAQRDAAARVAARVESINKADEEAGTAAGGGGPDGVAVKTEEGDGLVFTSTTEFVRSIVDEEEDKDIKPTIVPEAEAPHEQEPNVGGREDTQMDDMDEGEIPADGGEAEGGQRSAQGEEGAGAEATMGAGVAVASRRKGLAGALEMLRGSGALGADAKTTLGVSGRRNELKGHAAQALKDRIGDANDRVRLERYDEFGRVMTPKEAFRELCHRFHGKAPGKKRMAKRLKQYRDEQARLNATTVNSAAQQMEALRKANEARQAPFQVLSGKVNAGQSSDFHVVMEKDAGDTLVGAGEANQPFLRDAGASAAGGGTAGGSGGWTQVAQGETGKAKLMSDIPVAKRARTDQ
eukprot:PRCOL_00003741-RA